MNSRICRALLSLLAPTGLKAQQGDTVRLNPVVVTATRLPTAPEAVAAAVSVLSGDNLRAQGITTVADALRTVPGAVVVQSGSFGGQTSLFLRGGESDYVRVLIDGVPVNQPGGSFDFAHLTTDNVERIEVLRGPASVLYGSDAVTGVVQLFTRRGAGGARSDLTVRAGTYGTLILDGETSGGGPAASYSFSLSRFGTDGLYAFNNRYRNTVFSGLARLAPDARSDATLSLRYADNTYHFPTDGAGVPVDHNQFNYSSGPTVGLDLGHYFAPRFETRALLAVNETDGGFDNRPDGPTDTTGFYGQSLDHVRRMSADVREIVYVSAPTVLTAGATFEEESQRTFNQFQSRFGNQAGQFIVRRGNDGFYLQAVSAPGRHVTLNLGARLDDNQRFGTFATYRVGAVYRVGGARFRATVGTGFKEPTFFENYSTGFAVGNTDLRPERSQSWESGVDAAVWEGRATVSATYFNQRFRDLIDFTFSPAPPATSNYFNVAGATADGVELGLRIVAGKEVSFAAAYTYLHTSVTDPGFDASPDAAFAPGQPLLRRPTHAASWTLDYRPATRSSISLAVRYVGARTDQDYSSFPSPRVTLVPYTRVDVAGAAEIVRPGGAAPGLAASVRVENLFAQAYQEVKNFPAPGRSILIGAQLRFGY